MRRKRRVPIPIFLLLSVAALSVALAAAADPEASRPPKKKTTAFTNRGIEGMNFVPVGDLTIVEIRVSFFSLDFASPVNHNADYAVRVNGTLVETVSVDRITPEGIDCSDTCGGCPAVAPNCTGCSVCTDPGFRINTRPLPLRPGDNVTVEIIPARGGLAEIYTLDDFKGAKCCSCPALFIPVVDVR